MPRPLIRHFKAESEGRAQESAFWKPCPRDASARSGVCPPSSHPSHQEWIAALLHMLTSCFPENTRATHRCSPFLLHRASGPLPLRQSCVLPTLAPNPTSTASSRILLDCLYFSPQALPNETPVQLLHPWEPSEHPHSLGFSSPSQRHVLNLLPAPVPFILRLLLTL